MAPTVLVVDDDADIRFTLRQVLREEGFQVREARDGLEALEKIAEEEPDLVLLDLIMPVLDGWQVLHALQICRARLPVVILSAVAPTDGWADYVPKPISYDRLLDLLEKVRVRVDERAAGR